MPRLSNSPPSMRAPATLVRVVACGAALLLPGIAAAEAPSQAGSKVDVEAADRLYAAAKAAMDRGDLSVACPQFAESQRLDPAAGTLLNLGECEARSGKLATALGHFEAARAALPAGDYRVAFADERIAGLTRRVPRLAVRWKGALGPDTRVQRDGVDVAPRTLGAALPVDPGAHHVVVTVGGRVVARADVTVDEGQVESADLVPGAEAGAVADDARGGSMQRTLGLLALGAGGLSFGVGVVFGVVAKLTYDSASSASNCPAGTTSCNATGVTVGQTAHTQAAIATGAIVAGIGVAAGGLALVLLAPRSTPTPLAVTPTVGANGAGLSLRGAW